MGSSVPCYIIPVTCCLYVCYACHILQETKESITVAECAALCPEVRRSMGLLQQQPTARVARPVMPTQVNTTPASKDVFVADKPPIVHQSCHFLRVQCVHHHG